MPYILPHDRHPLEHDEDAHPEDAGQLNFCLTRLCHHYIERKGLRYRVLNEVIGALESAKLELYRRVVVPYENEKITANGDVLPQIDGPHLEETDAPAFTTPYDPTPEVHYNLYRPIGTFDDGTAPLGNLGNGEAPLNAGEPGAARKDVLNSRMD